VGLVGKRKESAEREAGAAVEEGGGRGGQENEREPSL